MTTNPKFHTENIRIGLVLLMFCIFWFCLNVHYPPKNAPQRHQKQFRRSYPALPLGNEAVVHSKKLICVLVPVKSYLLYQGLSSVETQIDNTYDYMVLVGHDHDETNLAFALEKYLSNYTLPHRIVSVHNILKKPGPVFNELSRYGYDIGCDYLYRINDDTELIGNQWSSRFVEELAAFDPPNVGVVGPTCHEGNTAILTHDFVHRTHWKIFGTHYPPELTDWWLDDWISKVYGQERTKKLPDVVVKHHLQDMRYTVTKSNEQALDGLVASAQEKLRLFIQDNIHNNEPLFMSDQTQSHIQYNTIFRGNETIEINNLSSPLFVSFINDGFLPMAANFICNMQHVMPKVLVHHLVLIVQSITTAQWIQMYDPRIALYIYNADDNIPQFPASFGTHEYKTIMMQRGYALLNFLGRGIPVIWLEPDAAYFDDLLNIKELIAPESEYVFYDDYNMPCGCFIAFPGKPDSRKFYEKVVTLAIQNFDRNDQISLDNIKHEVSWTMLDKCKFRSGAYAVDTLPNGNPRLTDCDNFTMIVQHFNFIIGMDNKIEIAKKLNAWYVDDNLKCKQRDIKAVILTMDRANSLKRLVNSLSNSRAPQIDIHFSVDVPTKLQPEPEIIHFINQVKMSWSKGFVTSHIWEKPAGILKNWLDCWPAELYREDQYKATIILEDDLEVSPVFHHWFIGAHSIYGGNHSNGKSVGAVTGQRPQLIADLNHANKRMQDKVPPGVTAFAYILMATWSLSPRVKVWSDFRKWYYQLPTGFNPIVPGANIINNEWYEHFLSKGTEASMWEMYYIYFSSVVSRQYTLYPWIEGGTKAFVCNWREKGLHFDGSESSTSDFPLAQNFDNRQILDRPIPFVEWDAAFYE